MVCDVPGILVAGIAAAVISARLMGLMPAVLRRIAIMLV
jgi:hypothetical protein